MLDMRLRLPELMAEAKPPITSPYFLAQRSKGLLSENKARRLLSTKRPPIGVEFTTLDAIAKIFGVSGEKLLTDAPLPDQPAVKKSATKKRTAKR